MTNSVDHQFHIPVLGIGFSVDTPLKVAKYGITSVLSIVDDTLLEKLRGYYLKKYNQPYIPIAQKEKDSRARRITAYLNMVNRFVKEQFESLKNSAFVSGSEITKYFELLPDFSSLKIKYQEMLASKDKIIIQRLQQWLRDNIKPGSIDVNIMTKVDKTNYDSNGTALPVEYNDAHAALRGYASSDLESSIIFSAGMNPRLYSYLESFSDFYPDRNGNFKKKVIIKVSDFRSAFIQGKFLAKKGIWVSEYRIESGLNCGGHAFATDGILLGPILEEFKNKKADLLQSVRELFFRALKNKGISFNDDTLNIDVTVQGGVGTATEQEFLIRRYGVKSVGWGSPFLLVPEAVNMDADTLKKLSEAGEANIYLSDVSPLGIPFSNLRDNSKDLEKMARANIGKPGSPCTKRFLALNNELTDKPCCTASISFLTKKLNELKQKFLKPDELQKEYDQAVAKVCLCEGLTVTPLIVNNIENPKQSKAVSVCPGPNLAYFSKISSLKEMVDHIYGRINLIKDSNRPNLFIKELNLYIDYLQKKVAESLEPLSAQTEEFFKKFKANLLEGISYYKKIIPEIVEETEKVRQKIIEDLEQVEQKLLSFSFATT